MNKTASACIFALLILIVFVALDTFTSVNANTEDVKITSVVSHETVTLENGKSFEVVGQKCNVGDTVKLQHKRTALFGLYIGAELKHKGK